MPLVSFVPLGCSATRDSLQAANGTVGNVGHLIASAQSSAEKSFSETDRSAARKLAEEGIDLAERCITTAPEEAACYYWRAVNTGFFHRVHIIGYQRGVKRMIDDCMKVIELNEGYDHAGVYRILGELYTRLPQTGGTAESITRDLDLAENYLRQAIKLAPEYPENHIALAKTLIEKENFSGTAKALTDAKILVSQWENDIAYNDWRNSMLVLEKKMKKARKLK